MKWFSPGFWSNSSRQDAHKTANSPCSGIQWLQTIWLGHSHLGRCSNAKRDPVKCLQPAKSWRSSSWRKLSCSEEFSSNIFLPPSANASSLSLYAINKSSSVALHRVSFITAQPQHFTRFTQTQCRGLINSIPYTHRLLLTNESSAFAFPQIGNGYAYFSPATKSVCLFENESVCLKGRVQAYDCIPARREGGKGWKRKGQWKDTGEELKDRRLFKKWERRNKKSWCEKRRNVKKKDRKERWWKMGLGREKGSAQSLWEIFGSARAGQMDSSSHDALQPNRELHFWPEL